MFNKLLNSTKAFVYNIYARNKYKVKLGFNADVRRSKFAENCFVGENSIFHASSMGRYSYIANNAHVVCAKIGNFCSIGDGLRVGLGKHPTDTYVSTHPAFYSPYTPSGNGFTDRQEFIDHDYIDPENRFFIEIGHDVWIGNDVTIVDGISIGNGAVIAAGAIVTKEVAPYAIVGGIPAKGLKKRFNEQEIQKLEKIEWWNKDIDWIKNNYFLFKDINEFLSKLKPTE